MLGVLFLLFVPAAFAAATLTAQTDNAGIRDSKHNRVRLQTRDLLQSAATACDAATQRLALLILYHNTKGWPAPSASMSQKSMANYASSIPLTTSACMAAGAVLPDHCCWHGVQCCTPQTCTSASSQSCTQCSCTLGLVVGLSLGLNNVRYTLTSLFTDLVGD